ncbi:MAG: hypothetical protein ACI9N9_000063 [Enterobacterales bacterium]|jgi:hypothetical protein
MKDINIALRLLCQLQSALHTIDELSELSIFQHTLKQRTKSYLALIESTTNQLTEAMGMEEIDNYMEIIHKLDELASTITVSDEGI